MTGVVCESEVKTMYYIQHNISIYVHELTVLQYYKQSELFYVLSAEVSISAELLVEADAALQDTGAILVEP